MSQRIMTAALVVIAVAGVGMFFATWQTLGNVRTYLQDSQELNAALVAKLEHLSSTAPAATGYDWCEFRLELVYDTAEGRPADGLTATLAKVKGGSQTDLGKSYPSTTQQSDENGLIDFSPVPYGLYYLVVQTDEGHRLKKEIVIRPGADMQLTVICPNDVPTGTARPAVSFDGLTLPKTIDGEVWTLCRVYQQDFTVWSATAGQEDSPYGGTTLGDDRWLLWEYETVLISPDGRLFAVEWPMERTETEDRTVSPDGGGFFSDGVWSAWRLSESFSVPDELTAIGELRLPLGQYTADAELVVLQPTPEERRAMTWRTLTDEERAAVAFPETTEVAANPMEIEAGSTAQWTIKLASMQTLCVDGSITIVARPENYAMHMGHLGGVGGGFEGSGLSGGGFF